MVVERRYMLLPWYDDSQSESDQGKLEILWSAVVFALQDKSQSNGHVSTR